MVEIGAFCGKIFACQTQRGETALMWAAHGGHTACVRALVEAGAEKDAEDNVRESIAFSMENISVPFLVSVVSG